MTAVHILFLIIAVVTLGAALMVVTSRNLVHSALWLILTLFGIAIFYVLLNAGFLAVVQVVVYIGAIAILIIFAVMMTRRLVADSAPQTNSGWWLAGVLALVLFVSLAWMFTSWEGFSDPAPALTASANPLKELGMALVAPNLYVLPFELASVLLLAALIGSIIIAWEKK